MGDGGGCGGVGGGWAAMREPAAAVRRMLVTPAAVHDEGAHAVDTRDGSGRAGRWRRPCNKRGIRRRLSRTTTAVRQTRNMGVAEPEDGGSRSRRRVCRRRGRPSWTTVDAEDGGGRAAGGRTTDDGSRAAGAEDGGRTTDDGSRAAGADDGGRAEDEQDDGGCAADMESDGGRAAGAEEGGRAVGAEDGGRAVDDWQTRKTSGTTAALAGVGDSGDPDNGRGDEGGRRHAASAGTPSSLAVAGGPTISVCAWSRATKSRYNKLV
uniref:Uncharacterized protein n=1 Tax=Oryza rufipogon TaxID=4529 RepID=A0A0E0RFA4_ORYRU